MKVKLKFPRRLTANDNVYEKDSIHEFENPSSIARWIKRGCVIVEEEKRPAKKEKKEEKVEEVAEVEENVEAKPKRRGRRKKSED